MYEELDPLGMQSNPQDNPATSFGDLVARHPMVAVATSAAVGAAVVALVALSARRSPAADAWQGLSNQAADKYTELQAQVGKLLERLADSLPSKKQVNGAATDLGGSASKLMDAMVGGAKQSFQAAATAGSNVTQAAAAHPLLTSLVLGALGTVLASVTNSSSGTTSKADVSDKRANGSAASSEAAL